MKKYVVKLCLLLILTICMSISSSFALLPPTPISPTLDVAADASGGVEAAGNVTANTPETAQQKIAKLRAKIKKFKGDATEWVNDKVGKATKWVNDTVGDAKEWVNDKVGQASEWVNKQKESITGALHKKKKGDSNVASSREIQESQVADIHNEEEVVKAIYVLFGEYPQEFLEKYPNDTEGVKRAYKDKIIEFSNDSLIELYIASREMDETMDLIDKDISDMSEKYVTGTAVEANPEVGGETGEANDELNSWVNYYKVNDIYDSVLRIAEELTALNAQYEASKSFRSGIEPVDPTAKTDKVSENEYNFNLKSKTAHAQLSDTLPSWIKKVDLSKTKKSAGEVVKVKPEVAKSTFRGAGNQFADLVSANEITFMLKEATDIHNLMQQMSVLKEPFIEYNRMKDLHESIIERVKSSEDCVVSYLGRYYEDPVSAWLGKGCKYTDGLDIFCDTGLKVTKDNLSTLVEGDSLCQNDSTKICSTYGLNRYERRGGLAGWLLSAYKIAKAEKTLEFSSDDYATQLNDADISSTQSISNLDDMEETEKELIAENEQNLDDSSLIKPTDELKMEQNDREREILAWQLGALMSKKIGNEMMLGENSVYGTFKNKYPMWNDEKYFYEQYLENKYSNMKIFLNSFDMRKSTLSLAKKISNEIYVEEDEEEKEAEDYEGPKMRGILLEDVVSYNTDGFNSLSEAIEEYASANIDGVKNTQDTLDIEMRKKQTEFLESKDALVGEINGIYKELDELNIELNDTKMVYNKAQEEKNDANSQINAENMIVDLAKDRADKSEHVNISNIKNSAEKQIANAEKTILSSEEKAKKALSETESLRYKIDDLKDKLERKKKELKNLKAQYAQDAAYMEYLAEVKLNNAYEELKDVEASTLNTLISYTGTIKDRIFKSLIDTAAKAEEIVRQNALNAVNEAYEKIQDMEDDIFDIEKHNEIVKIHKEMLDKIKNPTMDLEDYIDYLTGYVQLAAVERLAVEVMAGKLFDEICQSNACYNVDTQYYVGIVPNGKDFATPKTIVQTYMPPLREFVHLDGIDYDNLALSESGFITKNGLLNVGAMLSTSCDGDGKEYFCQDQDEKTVVYTDFVPEVWKRILGPKGFVEKDVPILPLSDNGNKHYYHDIQYTDELMRGGLYPCLLDDSYTIDIENGHYRGSYKADYPSCKHIKDYRVYSVLVKKASKEGEKDKYAQYIDLTFFDDDVATASLDRYEIEEKNLSEISLFARSTSGLQINQSLNDAMEFLAELDDDYNKTRKRLYDNMILDKNQFGDYIKFVEGEMEYQKSLDQMEVKIDEARQKLITEFEKYGYTPPEKFDLADNATYKEILNRLNLEKESRVNKADKMLKGFVGKNDLLREKISKNNNTLAMLKMDNKELVSLSDMLSLDEVEKRLKTAQADGDTKGEYDKEVEKSYKENANNVMVPYCAVY